MIKVTVICVGKIKERAFVEAAQEYEKRLAGFCELKTLEIKPEPLPENPNAAQITAALDRESESILSKIPKNAAVYPLCVEGKRLSSEQFSAEIAARADEGRSLCFIIGGSHGLAQRVKQAGKGLSFSDMTFPHRLFRVMLLEQIYRAFTIAAGKKYHK